MPHAASPKQIRTDVERTNAFMIGPPFAHGERNATARLSDSSIADVRRDIVNFRERAQIGATGLASSRFLLFGRGATEIRPICRPASRKSRRWARFITAPRLRTASNGGTQSHRRRAA